ncbi:MAG TPA: arginine--tRNA ligase [bacterium]|nr:arginine--tRNA ligase [bacterium]
MQFQTILQNKIQEFAAKMSLESGGELSLDLNPEHGHYALPLFAWAKQAGQSPNDLFAHLYDFIQSENLPFLEKLEFINGFANFFIKEDRWQSAVASAVLNQSYIEEGAHHEKVMIEFSSPNPGKSFHIGHLRNTLIGQAVANFYKMQGFPIRTANYLNDTGLHIAKIIWYLRNKNRQPEADLEKWLAKIYAEIYQLMEADEQVKKEIDQIYQEIEAGDKEIWNDLLQLRAWSESLFKDIYAELGVQFDDWSYDSQMLEAGKNYVQELLAKKIAKIDDGAVIVDLSEDKLPNALILKSDQTALYITKDLALAKSRFEKFNLDKLIYVVGVEQKLHFQQIFKILEKDGLAQAKKCQHLSYELVQLPEGKMGSRFGKVVSYRDLIGAVKEAAATELEQRGGTDLQNRDQLAQTIGLAAIKLWLLKYDNHKKILFDIQQALDFNGDTGPYLLYTNARLNSLFAKLTDDFTAELAEVTEVPLLPEALAGEIYRYLANFNRILDQARQEGRPSVMANYALELAKLINNYYQQHSILKEESAELRFARVVLLKSAQQVLSDSLGVLGIELVERM